jgi:hypothetical protein
VENHWTNIFQQTTNSGQCVSFVLNCVQLPAEKQTRIGCFQQDNAAAHTADKRLHGYYIQDVFKQND